MSETPPAPTSFRSRLKDLLVGNVYYSTLGGVVLSGAVLTLVAAYTSQRFKGSDGILTSQGVSALLFWTLGPPTYFFLEDQLVPSDRRAGLKDSRELASKIWAAVLAALLFKLSN